MDDNQDAAQNEEEVEQNSMVMDTPSFGSSGSVAMNDHQGLNLEVQQQLHQPVVDPIQLGIVRVVYGPVLPPQMIREQTFRMMLPEIVTAWIPCSLSL